MMTQVPGDDVTLFISVWADVEQKGLSAIKKAKYDLGNSWTLTLDHLEPDVRKAIVGLAGVVPPAKTYLHLPDTCTKPWRLPGLLPVLHALHQAGVIINCDCPRQWSFGETDLQTDSLDLLLKHCKPTLITFTLHAPSQHSAYYNTLGPFLSCLARYSCSIKLLMDADFETREFYPTSDLSLMPFLKVYARARLTALSCHLSEEVAYMFSQYEHYPVSSDDEVFDARSGMLNKVIPAVCYLQSLKIRVTSLSTIDALNTCLPFLPLLEELDIHLTPPHLMGPEDVPPLAYCRDGLTLRLAGVSDSLAVWAGCVVAALSRQYDYIWLTWCRMTEAGGRVFLQQLHNSQILVKELCVFSLSGRPNATQFRTLSVLAEQLPGHTTLHW